MDEMKLFEKNEKEVETLIYTVIIYSEDIGMEFSKENCAMQVMKSGKRHLTDGMELPNQDKIRTLREIETCRHLGILDQTSGDERKNKERISQEN